MTEVFGPLDWGVPFLAITVLLLIAFLIVVIRISRRARDYQAKAAAHLEASLAEQRRQSELLERIAIAIEKATNAPTH